MYTLNASEHFLLDSAKKKKQFNIILFDWHQAHYREMPWRNTADAYHIIVSEVMLQQTQVDRVRTKYREFFRSFPTVQVLAEAPLGDVLRVWSGLGYNRRAKYLHNCAKMIVADYNGKFPKDTKQLMNLPGVGISTAAALMSFAYGQDEPMIDTNIRRIICRVFFDKKIPTDRELYEFTKTLIPKGSGREWNYAMLDLGATKCTARNHSSECPMMPLHGVVGDFVYKKTQKKFVDSNRFYRGRILTQLTLGPSTTKKLQKILGLEKERLDTMLSKLEGEHLIKRLRNKVELP